MQKKNNGKKMLKKIYIKHNMPKFTCAGKTFFFLRYLLFNTLLLRYENSNTEFNVIVLYYLK